jgi:ankyrin repeat protein
LEVKSSAETHPKLACLHVHADVMTSFIPLISNDDANRYLHCVKDAKSLKIIFKTGRANVDCFSGGKTKLCKAAASHDFESMRLLLQYGADPNIRCTEKRYTLDDEIMLEINSPQGPMPIHAYAGCDEKVYLGGVERIERATKFLRLLLERGASIDVTANGKSLTYDDSDGNFTPLFYAVKKTSRRSSLSTSDEHNLASTLLTAGANPNARSKRGNTPIHFANPHNMALFDLMVAHSADMNAKNSDRRTPFMQLVWTIRDFSFLFQYQTTPYALTCSF